MRKLILSLLVIISLSACSSNMAQNTSPVPTKSPEEVKKALSGLIEQKDEVQEISAYYAQTTIENTNKSDFYVYFIKNKDVVSNLHFVIDYVGTQQINTNWIQIRADEQLFKFNNIGKYMKKSFSRSTVREVYNHDVYLDDLKMLKAMANAEKTIVRLDGEGLYRNDIVLSKRQKQAIQNVLTAYKNAGGVNKLYGNEL
ncbi:hypothetical protein A8L34_04915 [Bacillus sp. FJAT-27264]|uniref:hypothetical protein n=1 Tax=Paenibacillus sp. (strain DSM 101736 / FJAT-27264) TaxID=1850362 RepID=UPI000807A2E2|nr:hypothetical protein [Bacillus sp. FJAT-27264]OBZ18893.1 hypothetical protein A8L34_04915 [Bacillus sp. FJAT-27264]